MHEYSLVASLVDQVARHARPGATVRRVHVRIGELAGVEADLFRIAFTTFTTATVCDGAELAIATTRPRWTCPACHRDLPGPPARCCGAPCRLVEGDEIMLDRIEMEVCDV
jgi:hydrogenase nickel incorporation protein HypA/HybF